MLPFLPVGGREPDPPLPFMADQTLHLSVLVLGTAGEGKLSLQLSGFRVGADGRAAMQEAGDGLTAGMTAAGYAAEGEIVTECDHQQQTHYMITAPFKGLKDGMEFVDTVCDRTLRVRDTVFVGVPISPSGWGQWEFSPK